MKRQNTIFFTLLLLLSFVSSLLFSDLDHLSNVKQAVTSQRISPQLKNKRIHNRSLNYLLRLLTPVSIEDGQKVRLGRDHDGGYVIIDGFTYDKLYSYGICDDISFEEDFVEKYGTEAYLFDHSIDSIPDSKFSKRLHWKKEGVAPIQGVQLDSIENQIALNGDQGNKNLFLKMDVEGAEWEVFANIKRTTLNQFKQIVLEIHWPCDDSTTHKRRKLKALKNLKRDFEIVHIHGNNYALETIDGNFILPEVLELTYVRKDPEVSFVPLHDSFPMPGLDMNNCSNKPDLSLRYSPFLPYYSGSKSLDSHIGQFGL